jgi:hypothetical protein
VGGGGADAAAQVGAALLLGHAHAQPKRTLVLQRAVGIVVLGAQQRLAQRLEERGRVARQHRQRGLRHGGRAEAAGLHLAVQVEEHRRAQPVALQLRACQRAAGADAGQQALPVRVRVDALEAPAARVQALQLGRAAVGLLGPVVGGGAADQPAIARQIGGVVIAFGVRVAALGQACAQQRVGLPEVERVQLVDEVGFGMHGMGFRARRAGSRGRRTSHGTTPRRRA